MSEAHNCLCDDLGDGSRIAWHRRGWLGHQLPVIKDHIISCIHAHVQRNTLITKPVTILSKHCRTHVFIVQEANSARKDAAEGQG